MLRQASDPGVAPLRPSSACASEDVIIRKRRKVWRWKVGQGIFAKFVKLESCSANDDGPPSRSDNATRNGMQHFPPHGRAACITSLVGGSSGALGGPSDYSLADESAPVLSTVVLGSLSAPETRTRGKSTLQPWHSWKASEDERDTNTMPGDTSGSKRDILHQSTTRLVETVPGPSIGGEATRLARSTPQAPAEASANRYLVTEAVVDGVSIANQLSPYLEADFTRSACDFRGMTERHEGTSRGAPHLEETGSSEAKICHEDECCSAGACSCKAQFRVFGAPGKFMAEEQDTSNVAGVGASEDGEASPGGPDSESSEDELFNSSVSALYGDLMQFLLLS